MTNPLTGDRMDRQTRLTHRPIQTVAALLITVLLTGCATIQHPATPNVQYSSMEQCMIANRNETPQLCGKVMHQQATNQAIQTGAAVAGTLAWLGYIAYI